MSGEKPGEPTFEAALWRISVALIAVGCAVFGLSLIWSLL